MSLKERLATLSKQAAKENGVLKPKKPKEPPVLIYPPTPAPVPVPAPTPAPAPVSVPLAIPNVPSRGVALIPPGALEASIKAHRRKVQLQAITALPPCALVINGPYVPGKCSACGGELTATGCGCKTESCVNSASKWPHPFKGGN